jgi:NAD(P)-dependent dehydrogenase (short-subunit alcohol dehydrogenase family)
MSVAASSASPADSGEGGLLTGKVAVITGIGPGMGRSVALRFARHGARVVLGARRADRLQDVADEVRALGGSALAVACDIADPAACGRLAEAAAEHYGRVDVLVQNAHHEGDWTLALDADPDEWRRIMDINLFGALNMVQRVVPLMSSDPESDGGSIVMVNSGGALRCPPTMGAYATSKAALAALTKTLAVELAPRRIRVNGIYLGPVAGENLFRLGQGAAAAAGISLQDWSDAKASELPLGHIPTPEECAGSVLFLASELSAPVTGQHLSVNGGQWLT